MSDVLQFTAYTRYRPRYIIMRADQLPNPFLLTPLVMRWAEGIWVHDLQPCERYWQFQAERMGLDYLQLIQKLITMSVPDARVVCAEHPWQGLVLLESIIDSADSFVPFHGPYGQKLLHNLTWQAWLAPLQHLKTHVGALPELASQTKHLTTTMSRLGSHGPAHLKRASRTSLQKRFGRWIGCAWDWTFQSPDEPMQMQLFDANLEQFPWRPWQPYVVPSCSRFLEYPVSQWQQVEPLLKEDLNKLCENDSWQSHERVTLLRWEITLQNLRILVVPLAFRNPHSLHAEAPEQATALMQAYYAFTAEQKTMHQREDDLDLPDDIPILAWRLVVEERIQPSEAVYQLFHNLDAHDSAYQDVLALENKLPQAIEAFQLNPSFRPLSAYVARRQEVYEHSLYQWQQAAVHRPLFVYQKPKELAGEPWRAEFLERVSGDWWHGEGSVDFFKSYHREAGARGKVLWVCRDRQGKWFECGAFD